MHWLFFVNTKNECTDFEKILKKIINGRGFLNCTSLILKNLMNGLQINYLSQNIFLLSTCMCLIWKHIWITDSQRMNSEYLRKVESENLINWSLPSSINEIDFLCNLGYWLSASISRCLYHSNIQDLTCELL